MRAITPCLWFNHEAEPAARYYVSIFRKNSRIVHVARYGEAGQEITGRKPGRVMIVDFTLHRQKLSRGGDPTARQCGWLKDRYGLSWQIIPERTLQMFAEMKSQRSQRAFNAMLGMKKLDIAKLEKAYAG